MWLTAFLLQMAGASSPRTMLLVLALCDLGAWLCIRAYRRGAAAAANP